MTQKTLRTSASRERWASLLGLAALLILGVAGCGGPKPRVALYCAQDEEFAAAALETFTGRTGLRVDTKFDTEKDKSVSLYVELLAEQKRPRCDVFWNNEILSTIRLQRKGMLEPYASPSAEPYPASCKAADDTWHAFASRARVLVVNRELVKESDMPRSIFDLTGPKWKGQIAMAKPQFGTSATQAACLFEVLGRDRAKQFYLDLKANKVQLTPGNKQVAELVGEAHLPGKHRVAFGITDTDDAIEEVKAGHPVAIVFPDGDGKDNGRMGTLFIPNTLAIIKGSPNQAGARQLVDFLLSEEIEAKLAEAESHQIPLNPRVKAKLPPEIKTPAQVKAMQVDFAAATDLWDETQIFLTKEFAAPQ